MPPSPGPRPEASHVRVSSKSPTRKWSCPACSFENEHSAHECLACGTPKPAGAAPTPLAVRGRPNPLSPQPAERETSMERARHTGSSSSTPMGHPTPLNSGPWPPSSLSSTPSHTSHGASTALDGISETEKRILSLERALLRRTDALAQRLDKLDRIMEQRFTYLKDLTATNEQIFESFRERQKSFEEQLLAFKQQIPRFTKTPHEKVGEEQFEILQSKVSTLARTTEMAVHEMMHNHMYALQTKLDEMFDKEMTCRVDRALEKSARTLRLNGAETPISGSTPTSSRGRPIALDLSSYPAQTGLNDTRSFVPTSRALSRPADHNKVPMLFTSGWAKDDQWQLQARQREDYDAAELELLIVRHEVQDWVDKQKKFERRLAILEAKHTKIVEPEQGKFCC